MVWFKTSRFAALISLVWGLPAANAGGQKELAVIPVHLQLALIAIASTAAGSLIVSSDGALTEVEKHDQPWSS